MKERKPVASEEARKKLKEAFGKLKQRGHTPFHKDDIENNEEEQKEEE